MKKIFLLIFISSLAITTKAQSTTDIDQIYEHAQQAYELGRFEEVDSLLLPNIKNMQGDYLVRSYRLLALSCLYQNRDEDAQEFASKLLATDPFYTAYDDTPRFSDMLEQLKHTRTTVSTASKMKETLEEVPVPVTLITEEMIRVSNAQSIEDLLMLYVPGFSKISSTEKNIAMRGIYGMAQETMLVMVDGHRINSITTNAAALDFRHSLDKIKQIEVLRGPASSLYGNVALTAVINIITKSGDDINGGQISLHAGSHKTYSADLLYGKGNLQTDIVAWGHIYYADGEKHNLNGTIHYLNGYKDKPAFELGTKIRWEDLQIEAIGQYCKTVPYHPFICLTDIYSYDKYHHQYGERPGYSHRNIRIDADYSHTWNKFSLSASAYANSEKINIYNILGDTVDYTIASILAQAIGITNVKTRGVWQDATWDDYSFGATISGTQVYELHNGMNGILMFGIQYENFIFSNAEIKIGADFSNVNNTLNNIFIEQPEHTISSFLQLKHSFTSSLIFSGGLRNDHKIRQDNRRLNTWSPRLSLVWLANDVFSMKAGYAYAFVDAPLFFRASTISLLSSGGNLDPETMQSYQVSGAFNWEKIGLKYDLNFFFNRVKGMIGYNITSENTFYNAGNINMGGIESVLQYSNGKTFANLNLTYQYPFRIEDFSSTKHTLSNVPKMIMNLTASHAVFENSLIGQFQIRANTHFQSAVECLENDLVKRMLDPTKLYTTHQNAYALFNAGIGWTSTFGLSASLDLNNIFDTYYEIGGQTRNAIPGMGRIVMCNLSYKF